MARIRLESLGVLVMVAAGLVAQQPGEGTVEGRLLEILRARGVITAEEHEELLAIEREMRAGNELEARVEALVSDLKAEGPQTAHKPGRGFTWKTADGKFSTTLRGFIQARLSHEENDGGEGEPNFSLPRTRLYVEGHAFETWWKYRIQFEVAGDTARGTVGPLGLPMSAGGGTTGSGTFTSGNRLAELKDSYLEFAKWKPFQVRFGQFKTPYSRQLLVPGSDFEFVDRAITVAAFAPGRNAGLMFFGSAGGEKDDLIEYYAGAFNGEGENMNNNDDGLMWVGRVVVNPFGGVKYSESDVGHSEDFLLALGLNAWFHDNDNHSSTTRLDQWSIGADLTILWQGFHFAAELHKRKNEVAAGSDTGIVGWHAQLGYFLIPHELEIGLRAAEIDWDHSSTTSAQREYLGVIGWFLAEHNLKIQFDFGRVELHDHVHSRNDDEWRGRLQAQIAF